MSIQRKYGWKPDVPDHRDMYYQAHKGYGSVPIVDLSQNFPEVYNQGELGSCTANAIAAVFQYNSIKEKSIFGKNIPSRLFIYYNEREIEGTINEDSGAEIRDGMKVVSNLGVCPESMWWYNVSKFAVKPNKKCYEEALKHKVIVYYRVNQDINDIKSCLAAGFPIVFGISVFESFEGDTISKTGIVPMPSTNESNLGGHAIVLVGYNDIKKMFKFRNSWGSKWGDKGYGYLPYSYVLNSDLACDFWTIRQVSK